MDINSYYFDTIKIVEKAIKDKDRDFCKNRFNEIIDNKDDDLNTKIWKLLLSLRVVYKYYIFESIDCDEKDYINDNLTSIIDFIDCVNDLFLDYEKEIDEKINIIRNAACSLPTSKKQKEFFDFLNKIQYKNFNI